MTKDQEKHILDYFHKVKKASKEFAKKEIFKDLLHRLYGHLPEIAKVIDAITAGSEKTILNIPRKDKLHRGSADTMYNNIIIEFENDLKSNYKHAKEQLAGYMLGQYRTYKKYDFTLIASDFINWKVVAPDVSQLEELHAIKEDELKLNEVPGASFNLNEKNAEEFYYWIDRFLFKETKQRATLQSIEDAFGYNSAVFIESFRQIKDVFQDAKKYGEVQVSYEQWKKFLSIAYGSYQATDSAFVIHTYLSVFAKMIAYSVVSNDDFIDDDEMRGILDGTIFHQFHIANFVDNDFFHWVHGQSYMPNLRQVFRTIAQEISTFDFKNVDEDVLKGVYQELIDLDTRHALGEYYTPDWLCERVVKEFDFKSNSKILDPSCGSGSFLRAAIHRLKTLYPQLTAEEINDNIYGIDIHPLSVQIAKTTVLIALGDELKRHKRRLHLNIILANTLLAPDGVQDLFGATFNLMIDKERLVVTSQILDDVKLFDDGLQVCDELAQITKGNKNETSATLEKMLKKLHGSAGLNQQIADGFHKIYLGFKKAKEKKRDSIWKFIVQNLYKPYFLAGKFDFIIGNPPWFTYASIKNEEYQDTLNALAEKYHVKPEKAKNYPHLEIASVFLSYCNSYFLKESGKLAFVLPRSFFSADHHDNTRSGKAKDLFITSVWDLNEVSPLFRVPSCVLFSVKKGRGFPKTYSTKGIEGKSFSGRVPAHNCNWLAAERTIIDQNSIFYCVKQGKSSAFSTKKIKIQTRVNPYKKEFRQGATLVPRTFYFVDLNMRLDVGWEKDFDWNDRMLNLKTAEHIKADAKAPWKSIEMKSSMESSFIFRTALSKNILPFALYKPDLVVLPIVIEKDKDLKKIKLLNPIEILREGYSNASQWFKNAEYQWKILCTEKSKKMSANDRVDYQRGITEQNLNAPFLVLYNSSAKDANCTIVERKKLDLEFIVESTAYAFECQDPSEALYLSSILNSTIPNLMMKDFQAKGLFGARHVHKKILDIYFPKYDDKDRTHIRLAELGKICHYKASKYLEDNPPPKALTAMPLGKLRTNIKKYLTEEMKEIDSLVKKIIS